MLVQADGVARVAKWAAKAVVILMGVVMLGIVLPSRSAIASSYNEQAATNYANEYWSSYNPAYPSYGNDCTNFVSQALYSGGLRGPVYFNAHMGVYQTTSNNYYWFMLPQYGAYSYSWTVAQDLYDHLLSFGYAKLQGTYPGTDLNEYSGVYRGDPIFFSWTSNGSMDHAVIQVGVGTDPYFGEYGNVVDSHTNNRYHAFWDLYGENQSRATTTVYTVHIPTS